jgi:hypothetical protein
MKRFFAIALFVALVSIPSFAAKNSQNVTIASPLTVGTTKLPVGEYKLTWTGTAPNVQVTIEQKGVQHPLAATLPAKLTEQRHERTSLITDSKDGVNTLENVELKDVTLDFTAAPANGQ